MSKAIVFLADGTEECEALITVDLLKRANIDTVTASVMHRQEILSSHSIPIRADYLVSALDFSDADALVLPGGAKGVENLKKDSLLLWQCRKFAASGKVVAAICAAPSILAELGLLNGKTATVNPGFEHTCTMANLTHGKAAVDGNIITGQAVGGTFEFALEIIRALEGEEAAAKVKANICL